MNYYFLNFLKFCARSARSASNRRFRKFCARKDSVPPQSMVKEGTEKLQAENFKEASSTENGQN